MRNRARLSFHRLFLRVALTAANTFVWIIIVKLLHGSLPNTALIYALSAAVVFFATPLTAHFVRRGLIRSAATGVLIFSLSAAVLALSTTGTLGLVSILGVLVFAICTGLYRSLYWVPYRAIEGQTHPLGVGFFSDLTASLAPVVAGYALATYGASFVLWSIGLLSLLSIIWLIGVDSEKEQYTFGYRETLRMFFDRRNRVLALSTIVDGSEAAGLFFVWPLVVYLLVGGNLIVVGTILSITLLATIAARLFLKYIRLVRGWKPTPFTLTAASTSSWLMRLGVYSPVQIISVDVLQNIGGYGRESTLDIIVFEQAADSGHFLDEYSALKEMGLSLGRALIGVLVYFLCYFYTAVQVLALVIAVSAMIALCAHFVRRYIARAL